VPVAIAALLDAAVVILFALAGRRSHGEDLAGVLATAAPFLIGLAAGWVAARAWRAPGALRTGLVVWAVGVPVGLVVRRLGFDRGVAPSFVVVALVVTGALLVGWRAVAALLRHRRGVTPV
jgi:hypothetical protein